MQKDQGAGGKVKEQKVQLKNQHTVEGSASGVVAYPKPCRLWGKDFGCHYI